MKTAGQVLQQARLARGLALIKVSQKTKIPFQALKAIELDQYSQLPALTFSLGFVRNYAQALGLNPEKPVALFKRGYDFYQQNQILPPALAKKKTTIWQPKTGLIISLVILLLVFGIYVLIQIGRLFRAPRLELEWPVEQQLVKDKVWLKGKTDPQVTLTVNGQLISLKDSGEFNYQYQLAKGEETLLFVVRSRRGQMATLTRELNNQTD